MANTITIQSPANDGDDHVVILGDVEVSGTCGSGSDDLLGIYGKVYQGSKAIADVGQKPWEDHENPAPIQGYVDSNKTDWEFDSVSPLAGAAVGITNTIIIWGDFEGDKCYVLARRTFTGVETT